MSPSQGKATTRALERATALGPDLVSAWLALFARDGQTVVHVAAELSQEVGAQYDSNRLLKWRRGAEPVPAPVQRVMRRDLLQYLYGDHAGAALAALMEPPARAITSPPPRP